MMETGGPLVEALVYQSEGMVVLVRLYLAQVVLVLVSQLLVVSLRSPARLMKVL